MLHQNTKTAFRLWPLPGHWHQHGIAVPAIEAMNLEQGFLLLEDFGDQLMLKALKQGNADSLYRAALDELARIAALSDPEDYSLPPYDQALLDREMALFPDWLLERHLRLKLSNQERALLDTTFGLLRESALAQPEVTVHRDYHSRNLLIRDGQTAPGVIDFQDAVPRSCHLRRSLSAQRLLRTLARTAPDNLAGTFQTHNPAGWPASRGCRHLPTVV